MHQLNEEEAGSGGGMMGSPSKKREFSLYYEPAYQLGLDMLKKIKNNEDVVYALLGEGLILRALDFALEQ